MVQKNYFILYITLTLNAKIIYFILLLNVYNTDDIKVLKCAHENQTNDSQMTFKVCLQ